MTIENFDNISVTETTATTKLVGNGIFPFITLGNPAVIGDGASYSIVGSSLAGEFILNTGSGEDLFSGGIIATFTLPSPMVSENYYVFLNFSIPNIDNIYDYTASPISADSFAIYVNALMPNRKYGWKYFIVG